MKLKELKKGLVVKGLQSEPTELVVVIMNSDNTVRVIYKSSDGSAQNVVLDEAQVALLQAPPELNPGHSRQPLIVDNKLAIPLYHGTSSLFYESINKYGLGGRNVVKELGVVELLTQLIQVCDDTLGRLHRYVPQKELDLLQLTSRSMAEPGTGSAQIMWR